MPTTIPYDPALSIGTIVPRAKLDILEQVATLQADIDASEDQLNSLISLKRSFDMTKQELMDMNISVADLNNESIKVGRQVAEAAKAYAASNIKNQPQIRTLKGQLRAVNDTIESPIDYVRTALKQFPIGADSVKFNAQFFKFNENTQTADNYVKNIKSFISGEIEDIVGDDAGLSVASSAQSQINQQFQRHVVKGTLVLTAACTHRQATVMAPMVLDVDKAIRVWNAVFGKEEFLDANDPQSIKAALMTGRDSTKRLQIISGASYGSSFVGMVHIVQDEQTDTSQSMESQAGDVEGEAEKQYLIASAEGAWGLDSESAKDLKTMLSSSDVTSHISVLSMGLIPSIKSNVVKMTVQQFADFSPDKMMGKLATLANATESERNTIETAGNAMRMSQQMVAMEATTITNVLSGVSAIEDTNNKTFDVASLLTAYENYIDKAGTLATIGVPINYFLSPISRAQLAKMWVDKYVPKKMTRVDGGAAAAQTQASGGGTSTDSSSSPPASDAAPPSDGSTPSGDGTAPSDATNNDSSN